MAKQVINVGTTANDGTGEGIRSAFTKTNSNFTELYDTKANLASPTFTGTVAGITKSMVGLGSVDNTADSAKPVSTIQQSALDLKANLASPTFSGTVSGITKAMVGLSSVDNTADSAKPVSTLQQTALNGKANTSHTHVVGDLSLAAGQVLIGKNTGGAGAAVELTTSQVKTLLALNNVDNTADADKPISDDTQTALNGKAATNHTHTIAQVTGLQTELDNKSATNHNHDITTLTGYAASQALKANASHTHAIADVTGLSAQLVHSVKAFMATPTSSLRAADVADTSFTVVTANSIAKAGVAATAETVFTIKKNDVNIGTITFDASSITGVIVISNTSDRNMVLGDVIEFVAPGSADATLARIGFVLRN